MLTGNGVWGFRCVGVSVYPTIYRETWGLGGMIVSYLLERFRRFVKHKLRENSAGSGKESQKEARKKELMERLVDVVVDTAKARIADTMKDEEGEGEGEVKQGKISSLIGLE